MFSRNEKKLSMVLNFFVMTICFFFIESGISSRTTAAMAAGQNEYVDKLIQDWENRYGKSGYWKVTDSAEAEKENTAKSRGTDRPLLRDESGSQAEAFRNAVKLFINSYDLSSSRTVSDRSAFDFWFGKEYDRLRLYSVNEQQ